MRGWKVATVAIVDTVGIVEGPVKVARVAIVGVVDTVGIVETPSKVASVASVPTVGIAVAMVSTEASVNDVSGRDGRRFRKCRLVEHRR